MRTSFMLTTYDGAPLDTSAIDFGAIGNRAELAAALDAAAPHRGSPSSPHNGGTLTITARDSTGRAASPASRSPT